MLFLFDYNNGGGEDYRGGDGYDYVKLIGKEEFFPIRGFGLICR